MLSGQKQLLGQNNAKKPITIDPTTTDVNPRQLVYLATLFRQMGKKGVKIIGKDIIHTIEHELFRPMSPTQIQLTHDILIRKPVGMSTYYEVIIQTAGLSRYKIIGTFTETDDQLLYAQENNLEGYEYKPINPMNM